MGKFSIQKKSDKYKISDKVATEQLIKLLSYYDIDIDNIEDKKLQQLMESVFNKTVQFIRMGKLEIKIENGVQIIQNTKNDKIIYTGIRAENKISMDAYEEKETHKRIYAVLGSLSGLGENAILKLEEQDMSCAECVGFIFLQV
jgi:hypothetical protein